MKTSLRYYLFPFGAKFILLLVLAFPKFVVAQGTLSALVIDSGSPPVGYALQGVGWSFVPSADLSVTAVSSTAPQVNFWLGTNQVIATFNYAGPYGGPPTFQAPTNFQAVSSLFLSAGQTYFISTQQTNFTDVVIVSVYGLNQSGSPYGPTTFTPSPYITQFASFYLSSSGQWSPTTTPGYDNANYAVLGPNFQFQVVPEPASIELSLLVVGVLFLRRRTAPNSLP